MNSGNYETQILETIQLLVDNAVSKANYDRTIQGTISRCVDATIGKYIVKYQDSSLYAYSSNTDITYPAGSSVYVLVPGNDMTKDKTILGTVDKLGPDYVSIVEGENGYEVTGINVINNTDAMFELCSYKNEDIKILYDRDNNIDLVNLDTFGFESYIKKSNSIICGATFRTALPTEQKFRGDYGIGFSLDFIDNASGETITKTYIVNVDEMLGNPYNYTSASRQYGIFEVDGANFLSVKQIYIFEYDFPNIEENQANDIFISKVELSAANALERETAATCALTFVTPQGIYFDDNDLDTDTRTIEAQIRIKGNAIDNDSQLVKYYWFIENNSITSKSEKFNQYGGAGWECLNQFNTIQAATEDTEALVEWVSGSYRYITAKKDNIAKETTYKCVAVYSNDTILSRTIVIYNYSSNYEISIKSNDGTTFYYDVGHPDLTCYVNGEELTGDDYSYIWSEVDNNNHLSILTSTKELNDTYNEAVTKYNELITQVENEQKLSGQVQEDLDIYARTIAQYESIMRIENNKIHNLTISRITNFSTYKCSVYKLGIFIGSASIIISNTLKNETGYYLVLENGNQVFKYNEQGISPASGSLLDPITVLPISFTLYNEQGQQINFNAIGLNNIHWKVPAASSMIQVSSIHGNPSEKTELYEIYTGYPELNFSIDNRYDVRKENNEIELIVNYKDKVISAKTNLTFTKEGELGTNGTSFICKIVPNTAGGVSPLYPLVTINEYNSQWELNYQPKEIDKWFKVQLWRDGEQIFENTESGVTTENIEAQVQWSILKNNYGEAQDETNLIINKDTGAITLDLTKYNNPANIIKCVIKYDNVDYYAAIPVAIARTIDENYFVEPVDRTGFRQVMYTADGKTPSYDSEYPFELRVSQLINGIKEDVSQLELSEFKVDYDWNVLGQVYFSKWQSEFNLIEKTLYSSRAKRNQKYFKPVDEYNGLCVTNALSCTISRNHDRLAEIHIPVYFYINRYGNSAMNGWDGNSISIDENNSGVILAPQVGAGKKNEDNTFTGVFMGSVKEAGADKIETGLFGYSAGQRTITLNSENGSAAFGATGSGQIIIDPSTGAALLRSGNFDREKGTGMQIDLSEPSIEFGSGNFGVDKNGQMYATGFATTEFVRDELNTRDGQNSIKLFDVAIDIPMVLIPCTSDRKPLATKTYNIITTGTFKGQDVTNRMDVKLASAAINNIETVINKNIITFTVTEGNEITEDVNNFIFLFTYKDGDNTYTINKSITLGLIAKGKDGGKGENGKSTYQEWLDAGNTGSEEDFLNSLKGKDGEVGPGAKTITIAASAQFFKSTQGANGIFTPEYIYLYPTFQNTQYGKWQYSINGGIDWVNVSSGVADLTIGTYNERVNSLRIGRNSSLYTDEITSISFKCEAKEDFDTVFSTISIAKIYDVTEINAISETKILYATTNTKEEVIPEDAWYDVLVNVENKYIWQKVRKTYLNGIVEDSDPVCVSTTSVFMTSVLIQYALSVSALEAPDEKAWSYSKPAWSDGYYIWSRIETTWSDGQVEYSTPLCDTDSQTLQSIINERANDIVNNLENVGCVRLFKDEIYIMNSSEVEYATEILCLNEKGIGFATKKKGEAISPDMFTSVWALDGTFDAQSINVINLSADNIKNGILRLYDEGSDNRTGKLLIFEGSAPASPTADYDEQSIVKISSEGIDVSLANGAKFVVDITNGFKFKSPIGEDVLSSSADGTTINITKTKIIEHIDFGDNLRGLVMERESGGKIHRGIGFIKI